MAKSGNRESNFGQDENLVEQRYGGFLKGVLQVVGISVMAVIAGYCAGVGYSNSPAGRQKDGYEPAHARQ